MTTNTNIVMELKINGIKWNVVEVPYIECKEDILTLGETHYGESTIYIQQNKIDVMIKTFTHELLHAWLYEYGYDQEKEYTNEDMCNIISASYSFISKYTEKYKKLKYNIPE